MAHLVQFFPGWSSFGTSPVVIGGMSSAMLRQMIRLAGVLLIATTVTLLTPASSEARFFNGYSSAYPAYYYGGYPTYYYSGYPAYYPGYATYYGGYQGYYSPGYRAYYPSYSYGYVPYYYGY